MVAPSFHKRKSPSVAAAAHFPPLPVQPEFFIIRIVGCLAAGTRTFGLLMF
jgi:hypothetical protein